MTRPPPATSAAPDTNGVGLTPKESSVEGWLVCLGTLSRRPGPLWVQLFLNSDPAEISQGVLVLLACISMSLLPPPPSFPSPPLSSLLSEIFVVCGLPFFLHPRHCGVSVTVCAADFGLRSGCESCVEAEIYHAGATHSLTGVLG